MTPVSLVKNSTISCKAVRLTSFHFKSLNNSVKSNKTQHCCSFCMNNSSRSAGDIGSVLFSVWNYRKTCTRQNEWNELKKKSKTSMENVIFNRLRSFEYGFVLSATHSHTWEQWKAISVSCNCITLKWQRERGTFESIIHCYLPVNRGNGCSSRSFDILNRELYTRLSFFGADVAFILLMADGAVFAIGTGGGPRGVSASPFRWILFSIIVISCVAQR